MGLLSPAAKVALQKPVALASFVELEFSFGAERYWTGAFPIEWDGETWNPTGGLGKISTNGNTQELQANGIELEISLPLAQGAPLPQFQNVQPAQYKNRPARVVFAVMDEKFQNVIHSRERRYSMDVLDYNINPDSGSLISLTCESELLAAGKRNVRRYTNAEQQFRHPGDLFFQFLAWLSAGRQIFWGQEGVNLPSNN